MTARLNLAIGQRFGRVVVAAHMAPIAQKSRVEVRCDCGNALIVRSSSLRSGNTTSCGCTLHDARSHGHAKKGQVTRTYRIWNCMRARCAGQISPENYADRGISVCERWLSFENFFADMGEAPGNCSLDRFPDNDGNYEPSNCRWATVGEQSRNRRTNVFVEYAGQRMCLADWAAAYGISPSTFQRRLKAGRLDIRAQKPLISNQLAADSVATKGKQ